MLLSSRVIDNLRVVQQEKHHVIAIEDIKVPKKDDKSEVEKKVEYEQYENIAASIIKQAKLEAESIRKAAIDDSRIIEENAYKEAYEKGINEGRKKGYEDAYNETVVTGKMEIENLKSLAQQNASNIVKSARYECEKYYESKELEIKKLVIEVASKVVKERIKDSDAIDGMVCEAIRLSKNAKTIIIKCNANYVESIKSNVSTWKNELPYNGEIFVIEDNEREDGCAVIEKDNGKIEVNAQNAIDKIKEIILKSE
ncbi:flagellar assembly protein FliH [Clostridium neuense]|uniref:Flagellar assembly protein FliH n=1 Tax=Clostridium neuense TaxID=1728934 RepID=A0ABW8TJG4_9CLOT